MVLEKPASARSRGVVPSYSIAAAVATILAGGALQPAFSQETEAGISEVVVTGSRITRRDNTADSPIVTVSSEKLSNSSEVGVEQVLNAMPQFVPGRNQFAESQAITVTPRVTPGISTANLRGLGDNRTLVLLDGRRTQPANATMVVDLNTIPSAAIDSVEVITGGAGSTYGADAVAGVVNFKLKRNYEGLTLDAQLGQTDRGDGGQRSVTALLGSNFGEGRGNAMIGLSFAKRDAIYRYDRDFFRGAQTNPWGTAAQFQNFPGYVVGSPGNITGNIAGGTYTQAAANSVFGAKGYAAGDVAAGTALYFNQAASTAAATLFKVGQGSVSNRLSPGYTGSLYPGDSHTKGVNYVYNRYNAAGGLPNQQTLTTNFTGGYLQIPLERYSLFTNAHYEFSDNAEVYVQASFDENVTQTSNGQWVPAGNQWGVTIPRDAAHPIPGELATILDSRGAPGSAAQLAPWTLNWNLTFMPQNQLTTTAHTYELLAGVRGKLGIKDWTYDIFASRGNTTSNTEYDGFVDADAYQTLINLPNYGAGAVFNNGRLGLLGSCTSGINPFVTTAVSQDCIDILDSNAKLYQGLEQMQAELNIQGSLFDVPAGELRFAFGSSYRKDDYKYLPDQGMNTTTITSVVLGQFDTTETRGSIAVKEVYAEVLAPVVKDLPFVKSLELNAGYRFSDYDTNAGSVNTWKFTANWDVNDYVKVRGGRQVANRAPNIAELYQPPVFEIVTWTDSDPCAQHTRAPFGNVATNPDRLKVQALCSALSGGAAVGNAFNGNNTTYFPLGRDLTQGNRNLESEEAKTWTVGAVFRSPFESDYLNRATLSIDWYKIDIDGAIATASTPYVYQVCFNAFGTNPTYDASNPFCQRINRDRSGTASAGNWISVNASFLNLSKVSTEGIDAVFDYRIDTPFLFGSTGTLNFNVTANWLLGYDVQVAPDLAPNSYKDSISSIYGAQYKHKIASTLGYSVGPATVNLGWRYLPKVRNAALVTAPTNTTSPTSAYHLFNLNGRFALNETVSIRGGVDNLFDRTPPTVGANYVPSAAGTGYSQGIGTTDASNYDVAGRRYYIGVTAKF
ncbi:MAG: TonB-dependent receptor [Steroidobacteraceae bacterium]